MLCDVRALRHCFLHPLPSLLYSELLMAPRAASPADQEDLPGSRVAVTLGATLIEQGRGTFGALSAARNRLVIHNFLPFYPVEV